MSKSASVLKNNRSTDIYVKTANNNSIKMESVGETSICVKVGNEAKEVQIKDVYYNSEVAVNLLSVSKICKNGHSVI